MALRYSGTLELSITLRADSETYDVVITEMNDDARFNDIEGLKLPPAFASRNAADSAASYDLAADAALGFAADADGDDIYTYAACPRDDSNFGFEIRRRY